MGEEDASTSSAAGLIFQLTASSWPSCATALRSSWAGWHAACPCAAPAEQSWSHHLWLAGPAWLEEVQDFGRSPGARCCLVPRAVHPWLGAVFSFCTCFSVTMDFTGVSCKECGFGLLKTSWGSEGCRQAEQGAPEGSWGWHQHVAGQRLMLMANPKFWLEIEPRPPSCPLGWSPCWGRARWLLAAQRLH